jgi:hypothetical protein
MTEAIVQVDRLVFSYGAVSGPARDLIQPDKGEIVELLGPNGAGRASPPGGQVRRAPRGDQADLTGNNICKAHSIVRRSATASPIAALVSILSLNLTPMHCGPPHR